MLKAQIEILTDFQVERYDVEIPVTEEELGTGLAYRDTIPQGTGMLYDYHLNPGEVGMFTPDTRVAVDFIFIDSCGQILKISTAEPFSRQVHKTNNTSWVLEINGGESAQKGIQVGDVIRGRVLGNAVAFSSDFPQNAISCRRYGPQVFATTSESEFMYSFGVHHWINISESNAKSKFDLKLKNYEQQGISPITMTELEAKKHIRDCEQLFKEDFRQTNSMFFVWNHECIIKESPVEDKIYLYVYGKGWEEMEWWDDRKKDLMRGVYISSIRSTSKDVEDIIKNIETDKKKIKEVNGRNDGFVNRPDFQGEHFEAFGNVWDAVGVEDLEEYIKQLNQKAMYAIPNEAPLPEKDRLVMQYMQIIYHHQGVVLGFSPKLDEDIQIALLLKEQKNYLEFLSAYPLMRGVPNEVRIEGYHTWEDGIEGVFTADFCDTVSVTWFDPFYLYTKNAKPLRKKTKILFSGLALTLKQAKSNIVTIDRGALFEMQLQQFLKENPGKTAADMPPVKVEFGKGAIFLSTAYAAEYQYQAEINQVSMCKLGDKAVYKMKVSVMHMDDYSSFTLNLYAFEHILNGYKPKTGDFVHGVLWLTGYHSPVAGEE